ncbi:sensor histidine kinase [Mucilaginibacter terrae]|uniref:Signal transduction histidine kinase n=1 Tax=Mucilaginibacter terrae TaxID=1955052 RepID=A0ABU3GQR0_9SPHI|nr:histidine kinase [Mucilaginibacter terrae]MDT3402118.1 signal transduction histidine kinase [Mucilaginibacter terrae]
MQVTGDNLLVLLAIGTLGMLTLAISVIFMHVRNQNRLLKQKEIAQEAELKHQRVLLNAVITSQEAERKRIGQDLHDDIGASLSGLRLMIDVYQPANTEEQSFKQFRSNTKETIDTIVAELRHIAHHLSPSLLTLHGLHAALNKQLEFINRTNYLQGSIVNDAPEVINSLEIETSTAIYRVLEELLNNTIKHAKATNIQINFAMQDDNLMIRYTDDGIGLPSQSVINGKGMGMQNIESRLSIIDATYQINNNPGNGFRIDITYPVKKNTTNE